MTAEKEYSIDFTKQQRKCCLYVHYNGVNCYIFVNSAEVYKLKAKASEVNAVPLCLRNVSKKKFSVDNMKTTGLWGYGYAYYFSLDYDQIDVDGVLDIHEYLINKHDIK